MTNWLRVGGWALVAIVAVYIVFQLISIVFSLVAWFISLVVSLAIVGVLLFLAYLLIKRVVGGGDRGRSSTRERERIFE